MVAQTVIWGPSKVVLFNEGINLWVNGSIFDNDLYSKKSSVHKLPRSDGSIIRWL